MISSIGSSNLDSLLQSYRTLEERPIRRLESRKDTINNRISLFGSLKSKLSALESLARDLSYSGATSIFGSKTATVSDDSYLTVTASSAATMTSHSISVSQMAKADKIVSNQYSLSGTDIQSTLGVGSYSFDVTVNGESHQVDIDIEAGDDNEAVLNKIVSAVNNTSDIGVDASVLQDTSTTGRLVFTSEETGSDYEMTLSDVTGNLLSTIGMNDSVEMSGTSGGYIYDATELNAEIIVDGVTIASSSNTIENAISGLTINLQKPHSAGDPPVTVNIENDVDGIKSKLEDFIEAYNEVVDFIQTNTNVNTTTYERSALSGDFTVSNLKMQLRNILTQPVSGLTSGDPTILASIGITADRDGQLSISDSATLDDYLANNLDQVAALFNTEDGFANRLLNNLDPYTDGDGVIEQRKDVLQSQVHLMNNRISRLEDMVDRRIEHYRKQFSQLMAAQSMYSSQNSYFSNMQQTGFLY